jgi:hypothetical protein
VKTSPNRLCLTFSILLVFAITMACKVSPEQKNSEAVKPVVDNANSTPRTEQIKSDSTKPTANEATTGSLATPSETYKTACTARRKKDVEGLKRVLSKDLLSFFKEMGEAEKKTLDESLSEMLDQPMSPTDQSRNEQINGNTATLEYLDDKGKWSQMDFIKEGADWKMTIPKGAAQMSGKAQKKKGDN